MKKHFEPFYAYDENAVQFDETPQLQSQENQKLKKLLATKCSGEHAPDGLKNRLRQSIRQIVLESADVTVESGPDGTVVEVRTTRLEQTF